MHGQGQIVCTTTYVCTSTDLLTYNEIVQVNNQITSIMKCWSSFLMRKNTVIPNNII